MRLFLSAAALLALAACAHHRPAATQAAAPAPAHGASDTQVAQQTCHRETPIGSNIPVTRCAPTDSGRSVQQMRDDLPKAGATPTKVSQFGSMGD